MKIANKNKYKIQTKFHDKIKLSAKSIYKHINPYLKHENLTPDETSAEAVLYVEFMKEGNEIYYRTSFALEEWTNLINIVKIDYNNFAVIIENPSLVEEVSDFLRLCWIFKIPLYIVTKNREFPKLLKKAKEITKGIDYEKMKLIVTDTLPKNYTLVGFSKLARENESDLKHFFKEKATNNQQIAFVFGDDKFGLTQETRDKMDFMFHLTPETKKPLRACMAFSYVLGIYTADRL